DRFQARSLACEPGKGRHRKRSSFARSRAPRAKTVAGQERLCVRDRGRYASHNELVPANGSAHTGKAAKLPFPVHPHMLRHSTGYKLANDGHDTRSLAHYLGHRNLQIDSTLHPASTGSVCKVLAGLKANSVEHAPVPPGALLRGRSTL